MDNLHGALINISPIIKAAFETMLTEGYSAVKPEKNATAKQISNGCREKSVGKCQITVQLLYLGFLLYGLRQIIETLSSAVRMIDYYPRVKKKTGQLALRSGSSLKGFWSIKVMKVGVSLLLTPSGTEILFEGDTVGVTLSYFVFLYLEKP